jgi:LuxR family transcriptional regulator, maltose regulon positive regulatory protein
LAQGQLDAAIEWADTSGLHAEAPLRFSHDLEHLVFARVLIARGRGEPTARALSEALNLLDRLLVAAEANGRMGSVIEIVMLRALGLAAQGDIIGARTLLERALTLAAPEGYIRTFVDEGAPLRLLIDDYRGQIIQGSRSAAGQAGQRILAYVDILLAHFGLPIADVEGDEASPIGHAQSTIQSLVERRSDQARAIGASLAHPPTQIPNLIEPLSERELEVLCLIGAGHSNQAISATLIIAVSTVKRHINNIYGKLAVQSRTQALARARELDIL